MRRLLVILGTLACLCTPDLLRADQGACEGGKNRVAFRVDDRTFITVKDYHDWESVHLYKIENGRIVLVDSVSVRQDPQVDRIVEWRRIPVKNEN
jgi:hypothetical protein